MQRVSDPRVQALIAFLTCAAIAALWLAVPEPAVVLALCAAPIAVVIGLRNAIWICLGFIIFSFFRIHEVVPVLNPFRIPQLLALGTIGVLGVLLLTGRVQPYWAREMTLFALFFGLVTIGVFTATNRDAALESWTQIYVKIAVMLFTIAWLIRRESDFAKAVYTLPLAGTLVAATAIQNRILEIGLVEGTRVTIARDIGSTLGDPNDLSLVLLFPLSFAAAFAANRRLGRWERLMGGAIAAVIIAAIIVTQSRGGLLGAVAVLAVFAMRIVRSRLVIALGGLVALMGLFVIAGISDRASGGAAEAGIDNSAMGRFHAWIAAFRMAVAHPILGVGLANYTPNFWRYTDWWEGFNKAVHSTWFGVLAETGFLGFALFATLVVTTLRNAWGTTTRLRALDAQGACPPRVLLTAQAVEAGLVGFVVSGTFLTQGFTWPLYILIALAVATRRFAQRSERLAA